MPVGPLCDGTYEDVAVLYYTMPAAKMDLIEWIDTYDTVDDASWAANFETIWNIFLAIATHLHEIHTENSCIIHADIKPDNIVLMEELSLNPPINFNMTKQHIKFIDFDESIPYQPDKRVIQLHKRIGTDDYFPPEIQIEQQQYPYGTFTDAWALGLVLLMLINRSAQFLDDSSLLEYDIQQAHEFLSRHHISVDKDSVQFILDGLLEKDYEKRMSISDVLHVCRTNT